MRNEKISYKIREHTLMHVPYMVVCGAKEMESNEITIRTRKGVDLGKMKLDDFIAKVKEEVNSRSLKLLEE